MKRFWQYLLGFGTVALIGYNLNERYQRWLEETTRAASADSEITLTPLGAVEYDQRGEGSPVLHFHGGNVGHNGWFMLEHLLGEGFSVITPDRPGYLGTPLAGNGSPEAQADLFVALLNQLGIEKVAVVGVSAGGAGALQFALRYPERTKCLVLMSAITKKTLLSDNQLNSTLGRLVMSPRGQNPAYFLINQMMKRLPELALQDYAKTETTYEENEAARYIDMILADPQQLQQFFRLADAIVPALPRFKGVMNDLRVQQELKPMPLSDISAPTLIIHSKNDGDVPYENATYAAEHIPNAELITVEQFGHFVWWGDSAVTRDFEQRMVEFLRQHNR